MLIVRVDGVYVIPVDRECFPGVFGIEVEFENVSSLLFVVESFVNDFNFQRSSEVALDVDHLSVNCEESVSVTFVFEDNAEDSWFMTGPSVPILFGPPVVLV